MLQAYPALKTADPVESLLGLAKVTEFGLTTVSELSLGGLSQSPGDFDVLLAAAKTGRLATRIRAYSFYTVGADAWDSAGISQGDGDSLIRVTGYKLVADGSNQGFTGLQREPYLNSDDRGLAYTSAEELKTAIERAGKGWHLAIHGNGDAAIDNVLDACGHSWCRFPCKSWNNRGGIIFYPAETTSVRTDSPDAMAAGLHCGGPMTFWLRHSE